jgi:hypothetical protein
MQTYTQLIDKLAQNGTLSNPKNITAFKNNEFQNFTIKKGESGETLDDLQEKFVTNFVNLLEKSTSKRFEKILVSSTNFEWQKAVLNYLNNQNEIVNIEEIKKQNSRSFDKIYLCNSTKNIPIDVLEVLKNHGSILYFNFKNFVKVEMIYNNILVSEII